ncbi:hypothetical protein O6H91_04G069700 [Diphasiastrum complanatum]|uniref:Uncharacterized protein n=1 Tax=Diphasiastrum complanatum TaxID=34168 RepID=A0ACC2DXY3_DIPCM|nr:hypothetical protein O6H91_04G069700 [Diphasiastrum complanatum]
MQVVVIVLQINLQYYLTFGNLRLVLVDHSKLASSQQNLEAAIIEIIDNQETENPYPLVEDVHYDQVGSCSTMIAERCAVEAPELLLDLGMSRLLLAAILVNTSNLNPKNGRCTERDECMATLLLHGAGRLGHTGFFQELRLHLSDLSVLSSEELLSRSFKQWKSKPGMRQRTSFSSIGMSSLRFSLIKFMSRDSAVFEDLNLFLQSRKLQLLIIATGYYNISKILVRELLMASQNRSLIDELLDILDSKDIHLQLKPLHIPGLPNWAMAFSQRNVRVSRKQMQCMLDDIFTS